MAGKLNSKIFSKLDIKYNFWKITKKSAPSVIYIGLIIIAFRLGFLFGEIIKTANTQALQNISDISQIIIAMGAIASIWIARSALVESVLPIDW
ncbi:MAG: hypothetical protein KGL39_21155 [Patescibacteria group bacterium]|nr:hypothetical protein [Patescibacteria group bacterium]